MIGAGGKVQLPLVALAIVVWTLAVRLPFLDAVGEDEAFFLVVAQNWLDGFLPYRDVFDIKPPGLFLAVVGAVALFGPTLFGIKMLATAGVALAAFGLHLIARRHVSAAVAVWAPAIYVVTSLFEGGVDFPTLWVQAPFVVFAVLLAMPRDARAAGLGAAAAAGLLIGVAGMIKQTALFEAVFVLALLAWRRPARGWPLVTLVFGGAALVAPVLFGVYFWQAGALAAAFDQVVVAAVARTAIEMQKTADGSGAEPFTYWMAVGRLLPLMRPLLPVLCLSVLAWMRRRAISERIGADWFALTAGWAVAAIAGVLAARAVLSNYLHTFVAPAALASGVVVWHGLEAKTRRRLWQAGAAALCVVGPVLLEHESITRGVNDMTAIRAAAAAMRQAGLRPGDSVLALNRGLAIYPESGAFPRTRYVSPNHLLCAFPAPDADPLAVALAERPRFVLMADPRLGLGCEQPLLWARFERFVAENYISRAVLRGRWDQFELWERRPSTAAP